MCLSCPPVYNFFQSNIVVDKVEKVNLDLMFT
jgi:hypothetical protein